MPNTDLRYPIGVFQLPQPISETHLHQWIEQIASLPGRLEKTVAGLDPDQLNTPYRPGGWTVRQLIHHLADSHMNAYIRLKLGMTEDNPTIKPYDQEAWALLPDSELPVEVSLKLIRGVHERWTCCLKCIRDWTRTVYHPEQKKRLTLDELTGQYAWHGEHHLTQIVQLIERESW